MQAFKGDATELKMTASGSKFLIDISRGLSEFYDGAYSCVPFGQLIYDQMRFPLTNAIKRDIFIGAFAELLQSWSFCGTFESYILVFKQIFGEDVDIDFTVPAPGKLQIDITTSGVQNYNFIARSIVDDEYVYDNVVDDVGDQIVFAAVQGLESESELEKVLFTMVPNGIYTQVSLTIGS